MTNADPHINERLSNLLNKFKTFKMPGRGTSRDFKDLQRAYKKVYKAIRKEEEAEVAAGDSGNARLITLLEVVGYEPDNNVPGGEKGMLEENTITEINTLRPILFPGDYEPVMTKEEAAILGGKKSKKHKKRKTKRRKQNKRKTKRRRKSIKRR